MSNDRLAAARIRERMTKRPHRLTTVVNNTELRIVLDALDEARGRAVRAPAADTEDRRAALLLEVLGAEAVVVRRDGERVVVEQATREVGGMSTAHRWVGPWIEEEA